jgi:hypothetical protein
MQLNHIGIADSANIRPVRYLPADLCAIGSSGWTRNRTVVPAHAACARHCGRSGAGFGSYTKVQFATSFVVASFTHAQLRRLPTDGIQGAQNPSIWLTHV